MDTDRFDRITRRLVAPASRRRALATMAGGMVGMMRAVDTAAAPRCQKPQRVCKQTSDCCDRKRFTCGHSHGGGTVKRTCCGTAGAPCNGNALGCCIPLICNADNRCAAEGEELPVHGRR